MEEKSIGLRIRDEDEFIVRPPSDQNELEEKIKEAKATRNEGRGLLLLSAITAVPAIAIMYHLNNHWSGGTLDTYFVVSSLISVLGSTLGMWTYSKGSGKLEYYQRIQEIGEVQQNLFR